MAYLIEDCEDVDALKSIILKAINADNLLEKGVHYNDKYLLPKLEQKEVRAQVLKAYDKILRV